MSVGKETFKLICDHYDLIERIYHANGMTPPTDKEGVIARLESKNILRCDYEGQYRLSSLWRSVFDNNSNRERAFSVDSPISEEITSMQAICTSMKLPYREGDDAGSSALEGELIDTIDDLQSRIDKQLNTFDLKLRNGYHDAKTIDEKIHRNAYYQERAKALQDAVDTVNGETVRDLFDHPHTASVRLRFHIDILSRIDGWSSRLTDMIKEMLDFMYRSKIIDLRTKKFRAACHALRNVSEVEKIEVLKLADVAFLPVRQTIRSNVDFRAEGNESLLSESALKIKPDDSKVQRRRAYSAGKVLTDVEPYIQQDDPLEILVCNFVMGISKDPKSLSEGFSVRNWATKNWENGDQEFPVDVIIFEVFQHILLNGIAVGVAMDVLPDSKLPFTSGVYDVNLIALDQSL